MGLRANKPSDAVKVSRAFHSKQNIANQ